MTHIESCLKEKTFTNSPEVLGWDLHPHYFMFGQKWLLKPAKSSVDVAGLGNEGSSLLYIDNEYREI